MSGIYDKWKKFVGAVLKRDDLRRIAPCESFSTSVSVDFSSRFIASSALEENVPAGSGDPADPCGHNVMAIKFKEIRKATNNFRPETLLWEGKFGCVYKGWIDEHTLTGVEPGSVISVAVAVMNQDLERYWRWHKEPFHQLFQKEVKYVSQLRHPNLVKLIAYCLEEDCRFLVYEFMPRGSLDNHLFTRRRRSLSWATRIKVAIGAARGLSFLHDLAIPITYHGFDTGDIFLDEEFNAKLSGFGFAREGPIGEMPDKSRQIFGVLGFVAPEYLLSGLPTTKCDVFRFGVVLLELLSGLRLGDLWKQNQMDWTKPYWNDKIILQLVKQNLVHSDGKNVVSRIMDTRLDGQYPQERAYKVVKIARQCLSSLPKQRPTMAEVVVALEQL